MNNKVKNIVITGLGIAITFVATMFIKIPNGIQGYINLGDGFILIFSSILSPGYAFMVGGIASSLADIAGGYSYYFFFTLIIKGLEAIVVSILSKKNNKYAIVTSYILGTLVMIIGYFIASIMLLGNIGLALLEVPGNLLQGSVGIVIAIIVYKAIKEYYNN